MKKGANKSLNEDKLPRQTKERRKSKLPAPKGSDVPERSALAEDPIRFLSFIAENISDAITVSSTNFAITYVNKAGEQLYGYTRDELKGKMPDIFNAASTAAQIQQELYATVSSGKIYFGESLNKRKDGSLFYCEYKVMPLKNNDGEICAYAAIQRDITERRQAENEVRKLNESLEQRVQDRTVELARANQELETLIRIASHDLRSPLVNIQGFNQLLNKACDAIMRILAGVALPDETRQAIAASSEKAEKSIRFINAGVAKMNGLVNVLLRLSQLGRAPLALQPLDMNALLQAVVDATAFQIRTTAAEITVDVLPDCRADSALINQVFSNLLDNAIKYRDPARPLRVHIWGRLEQDSRTVYCVEDNGLGVAPEHQQKIWDLFYRPLPQVSAGEGIGLPVVQRIVERHGGKVWMESEIGKGSRFFLSLPTSGKEPEA